MRTFDLNVVQRALRDQLQASEELFDVIDELNRIAAEMPTSPNKEKLQAAVRKLASIGNRIVAKSGQTNSEIRQFLTQ